MVKLRFLPLISFFLPINYAWAEPRGVYGKKLCQEVRYSCVKVGKKGNWKNILSSFSFYRVDPEKGVVLENVWDDENARMIVMKLNRLNISLSVGMVIAVPNDLSDGSSIMDYSPFPLHDKSIKEKTIIFSPRELAWAAYEKDGRLNNWGPASGGKRYCPDKKGPCLTAVGKWLVHIKGGPLARSTRYPIGCKGMECAPTPYVIYFGFDSNGFHASEELPGRNASHGCVRLFMDDARWLNREFAEIGTRVIVRPY